MLQFPTSYIGETSCKEKWGLSIGATALDVLTDWRMILLEKKTTPNRFPQPKTWPFDYITLTMKRTEWLKLSNHISEILLRIMLGPTNWKDKNLWSLKKTRLPTFSCPCKTYCLVQRILKDVLNLQVLQTTKLIVYTKSNTL